MGSDWSNPGSLLVACHHEGIVIVTLKLTLFFFLDGQQLVEMFCAIKEVETLQEVRLALHQTCTKTKEAPLTKAFLEQLHHQKAQKYFPLLIPLSICPRTWHASGSTSE